MSEPTPWREIREPASLAHRNLLRALDAATRPRPWPRERRLALLCRVRGEAARRSRLAARHRRAATWAALGTACAIALAVALARGRLPGSEDLAPELAFRGVERSASAEAAAPGAARVGPGPSSAARLDLPSTATWTRIDLGDLGLVESSPAALLDFEELEEGRFIHLRSGLLRAQVSRQDPDRPVIVTTPQLRLIVVGTRFDVGVAGEVTTVDLIEGVVRVESAAGAHVLLHGGEQISSSDPRLRPPAGVALAEGPARPAARAASAPRVRPPAGRASAAPPAPAPGARMARCEEEREVEAQRRCFERVASEKGLAAENALFRLGLMARDRPGGDREALELLREHQRRFPHSVFASEAALQELALLERLGERAQLVEQAIRFEQRFFADPRVDEVTLMRAAALCALGRAETAWVLLERLSTRAATADVREAARAWLQRCPASEPGDFFEPRAGARAPPSEQPPAARGPGD